MYVLCRCMLTCSEEGENCPIRKVMATFFWDSQGAIYIDYMEKGKMVIGLFYDRVLGRFVTKKRPHLAKKEVNSHTESVSFTIYVPLLLANLQENKLTVLN